MTNQVQLRSTDRTIFKQCRQKWDFASVHRRNMHPRAGIKAFEFGTAIHAALEVYYDPTRWWMPATTRMLAGVAEYLRITAEQIRQIERNVGGALDPELKKDFDERTQLGIDMLQHYRMWAERRDNFTPVYTEIDFELPLDGRDGGDFYVGDQLIVYAGRIDLVVRDKDGDYWVVDHKAQPLNEPVLTPGGWTEMGSLSVGDLVIGSNGKPTAITGVFPQGSLKCFEVMFHDGTKTRCSEDHLWKTEQGVQQLKDTPLGSRVAPVAPVEFEEKQFPVHPYLLGLYLGDGYSDRSTVNISSKLGDTIRVAEQYLPEGHYFQKNSQHNHNWTLRGPKGPTRSNRLYEGLITLGLLNVRAYDKFVPAQYLYGSVDQRLLLLQGLMDSDGIVANGQARFCTKSEQLTKAVLNLVRSLGGIANVSYGNGASDNAIKVNFRLPMGMAPFQLSHKVEAVRTQYRNFSKKIISVTEVEPTEMQCISVEASDGLYVTSDYILTHNTAQNFSDRTYLDLDTQASSYLWAFRKQTGIKPKGIIFNQIKKTSPKKPSPLARGGLSKNKQQNTTYDLYMEAIEENGLNPEDYEDILSHLWQQEDKFVRRTWVDRSDKEMRRIEEVMRLEAEDMFNNPNIYPSPSPMNCNTCPYNAPCLAIQDGSDVKFMLDEGFVHGDNLKV